MYGKIRHTHPVLWCLVALERAILQHPRGVSHLFLVRDTGECKVRDIEDSVSLHIGRSVALVNILSDRYPVSPVQE